MDLLGKVLLCKHGDLSVDAQARHLICYSIVEEWKQTGLGGLGATRFRTLVPGSVRDSQFPQKGKIKESTSISPLTYTHTHTKPSSLVILIIDYREHEEIGYETLVRSLS